MFYPSKVLLRSNFYTELDRGQWSIKNPSFFDSGNRSAIFGTPKMTKMTPFWPFWGYQKWHFGCPNQNSETTFKDQTSPQNPQIDTLGTQIGPRKVTFGHFLDFEYLAPISAVFTVQNGEFFQRKTPMAKHFFLLSNFFQVILRYKDRKKSHHQTDFCIFLFGATA